MAVSISSPIAWTFLIRSLRRLFYMHIQIGSFAIVFPSCRSEHEVKLVFHPYSCECRFRVRSSAFRNDAEGGGALPSEPASRTSMERQLPTFPALLKTCPSRNGSSRPFYDIPRRNVIGE